MNSEFKQRLLDTAATRYKASGNFAYRFARGKLGGDPVFTGLLAHGLLPSDARVLDIGCGQGLLAAWLHTAQTLYVTGDWPADWPAPPTLQSMRGIELMPLDVKRAQQAMHDLSATATFVEGDMCTTEFGKANVVVILDVLHYVSIAAQDDVLRRVRDTLLPNGTLLLRVGDASAGLPFKISQWVDHVVTFVRGHRIVPHYCRSLSDWLTTLYGLGFSVEPIPMHQGTPFANILLVARFGEISGCRVKQLVT